MKKTHKVWLTIIAGVATLSGLSMVYAANLSTNLTWCATNSGAINVSYQECVGLAHLYHETSGDNWSYTGNWFSNVDLSTWSGGYSLGTGAIKIAGGHIVRLDLGANGLSGSVITGLQYLPYLTSLELSSNSISAINLSQNTGLIELYIGGNSMTGVNLTLLTGLVRLGVGGSNMSGVDVSQNVNLRWLAVDRINTSWIDFSHNTLLTGVLVSQMPLTGLDFTSNPLLEEIFASYNLTPTLATINVSGLTLLKTLYADYAGLRSIDLRTNTSLQGLGLSSSFLTGLNLSGLTNLTYLGLYGNSLSSLDVSTNRKMQGLYIGYQSGVVFSGIDISNNTGLHNLDLSNNPISRLTINAYGYYSGGLVANLSGNVLNPNALDLNTLWFLHNHYADWGYKGFAANTPYVAPASSGGGGGGSSSNVSTTTTGQVTTTGTVATGTTNTGTVMTGTTPELVTPNVATDSDIYAWAYSKGITTLPLAKARLRDGILRYEAAKMIVQFAENVMNTRIEHNSRCNVENYTDAKSFDAEMKENITKICDLGLMGWKGDKKNILEKFRPFDTLSATEFGIVIGRYLGESENTPASSKRVDIMRFLYENSGE